VLRRAAGVVALLLTTAGIAACGDDGERAAGTTTTVRPTTTSSTTTTEPEDPWAVPENIDEAYVQRVLTELYRLDGEARRIAVREGMVTEEVIEFVQRIYIADEAAAWLDSLIEWSVDRFDGVIEPPGNVEISVEQVDLRSEACVVVRVIQDFSGISTAGVTGQAAYLAMHRSSGNHTEWLLGRNAMAQEGEVLADMGC
jgi:hypothetical protein